MRTWRCLVVALGLFVCSTSAWSQTGDASTYGWNKGRGDSATQKVSCGGRLNVKALTAAHRSLPCGTRVRVTNVRNNRSVVVTINDRGPFVKGRIIDLSPASARAIGMGYGKARVKLLRLP